MLTIALAANVLLVLVIGGFYAAFRNKQDELKWMEGRRKRAHTDGMRLLAKMVADGAVKAGKLPVTADDDGTIYAIGDYYDFYEFEKEVAKHAAAKEARKRIFKALPDNKKKQQNETIYRWGSHP